MDEEEIPVTTSELPNHKGKFGIKGNFRDILGTLGDAFLTHAGKKAIYQPMRDRENMSDALLGTDETSLSSNPMLAVSRLNKAGFPEEALDLLHQVTQDEAAALYKRAQAGALEDKALGTLGSMSAAARAGGKENYGAWLTAMRDYAGRKGLKVDIPDTFDETRLQALQRGGMTGYQADMADWRGIDTESKVKTRTDRTNIQQQNANRPRPGRAPGRPVVVEGPDGKPVYVTPEQAPGKRPYGKPAAPSQARPQPTEADITYLRQNPTKRDMFDGRFGVGMAKKVLGQ